MVRKLKVFAAPIGFYETVVAVPSRAAAQRAWGVHQDLFKAGMAHETDDATATKSALAQPGEVLKRPIGSKGAFKTDPEGGPVVAVGPTRVAKVSPSRTTPAPPKPRPKPDRSELTAAEAAVEALAARRRDEQAALKVEADAVAARKREGDARFATAQREARQAVAAARRRYRAAGGR